MDLFLKRLKEAGIFVLLVVVGLAVIAVPFYILKLISETLFLWIVLILFAFTLLFYPIRFIYWLLIEPFKK